MTSTPLSTCTRSCRAEFAGIAGICGYIPPQSEADFRQGQGTLRRVKINPPAKRVVPAIPAPADHPRGYTSLFARAYVVPS
jgi:hypothetical protein